MVNRRAYEVALPILTAVTSFGAVLGLGYVSATGPWSQPVPTPSPTGDRPAPPSPTQGQTPGQTQTVGSDPGASKLVVTILDRRAAIPLPGLLEDRALSLPGRRQLCLVDVQAWQPAVPGGWYSPPDAPDLSCLTYADEAPDPVTFVLVRR